jgi:glycyl-tRNA synthetase
VQEGIRQGEGREYPPEVLEKLVSLCKRRGFVFQSAEIYGGFRSAYDYGPLGVELINNIKACWWESVVRSRDDVVGLDSAILTSPRVWEASGHLAHFTDPLIDCRVCKERFREDQARGGRCPRCGSSDLTPARPFNLMFKTFVGPVEDDASVAYLRPETAQGIFVNFQNVVASMRMRPPFGVAQIGKAFRNEITPQNFVFRTREFEQMELEYFVRPDEADKWFDYWLSARLAWYKELGIAEDLLRVRFHGKDELSHYSSKTADIEFFFPWGWGELEGVAHRGDYDLTAHSRASGKDLSYYDPATGERYTPHVIEPSAGVTRSMMAFLLAAYDEDVVSGERRVVLRLSSRLAPVKVAVLPLSKTEPLCELAREVAAQVRQGFACMYDETQSIGRRYRRQDEIGTPYCVTIDFESLEDKQVTIRDRDTTRQVRVPISELNQRLEALFSGGYSI